VAQETSMRGVLRWIATVPLPILVVIYVMGLLASAG
jgi:hypothetical protein